eukprot:CAMPEP_0196583914 /NCGR_PEP_ID=MMETSP1081-20130531/45187_1 /TAXON_ID=36882 /ORGANISM="Pyramimonas amylifera, Strain CCMP720" /LENGTH=215 /DNA_ID=CAMNT_0041904953 /DNA_START=146 /DNA_END=794 /DNA_ORIENTATION=+
MGIFGPHKRFSPPALPAESFPFADTQNLQTGPSDLQDKKAPEADTRLALEEAHPKVEPEGLYKLFAKDIDGTFQEFVQYAGSVTLVVNVASKCGFTITNYQGLEELYGRYKDQGFQVMAFPCNQFGGQEPDDDPAIKRFAVDTFGVTFPMFSKVDVNGIGLHPVYQFIKDSGPEYANDIEWNFVKFLINKQGQVVARFPPTFDLQTLRQAIEQYL